MDFSELKRLDSYDAATFVGSGRRMDDNAFSIFAQNELQQLIPKTYDRMFRELDALQFVPVATGVNAGAMAFAYDSFDMRGTPQWIGAGATDLPRGDVSKGRFVFPIRSFAMSYGWTIEEMMAARFAGQPLDVKKANAVRRSMAEMEHKTILFGEPTLKIPGFLMNPSTPRVVVPNGNWLAGATADQMLGDLETVIDAVWVQSNRVHTPNTLALPLSWFRRLQNTRIPNTGISARTYFLENNAFVQEIRPLTELETAGPGGAPAMLTYDKNVDNLSAIVVLPYTALDPQVRGMETMIPVWERIA